MNLSGNQPFLIELTWAADTRDFNSFILMFQNLTSAKKAEVEKGVVADGI